jgi:type VI secretion system protein ImpL
MAAPAPIRSALRGEPPGAFETRLIQAYLVEVIVPCATLIDGHYPFGDGPDLALGDFGRVFGTRGLFDTFFNEHLADVVETSKRPWTLRRSSLPVPNDMLRTVEQAVRIREMFFAGGSQTPELQFSVRLSRVDPAATRFVLAIDGQRAEAGPGVDSLQPMIWPGGQTGGETYLSTEDRAASPAKVAFSGPWAAFRMADALALPRAPQGTAGLNAAIVRPTQFQRAQITIETAGSNPFASREWRQFRCSSTPTR